jgi:hypothetical protein
MVSNNNSLSQSLVELDRRAYEGQLKTYDRCVWSYNRLVNELNVKGLGSLFEVCGEPPIPPKSVRDQGDPNCGSPEDKVDRTCWYRCDNGLITWPGRGEIVQ